MTTLVNNFVCVDLQVVIPLLGTLRIFGTCAYLKLCLYFTLEFRIYLDLFSVFRLSVLKLAFAEYATNAFSS